MNSPIHDHRRRGMTLIELLVVISIIVLVAGAFVPMLQPLTRGRRVREAARQVNVFIGGAQARAVEQGRPVGIWLERAGHEIDQPINAWYTCYRMYVAELPDAYTGDLFDARVVIKPNVANAARWFAYFEDPDVPTDFSCCDSVTATNQTIARMISNNQEPTFTPLVNIGDWIQFDGRGPHYMITGIDATKFEFFVEPNDMPEIRKFLRQPMPSTALVPGMNPQQAAAAFQSYQAGVRFAITRGPVKSSVSPFELPRNTAIDFSVSGYGVPFDSKQMLFVNSLVPGTAPVPTTVARFREINPEYDIVIMFSPQGGVDRVYYAAHEPAERPTFVEQPQGPLHLLVTRDDKIARNLQKTLSTDLTIDFTQNVHTSLGEASLEDQDNLWLTMTPQSGRVLITPNSNPFSNPMTGAVTTPMSAPYDASPNIIEARRLTGFGSSVGGN
ncbi:MAG: prepilin-type N-terminal cleavage/methylation domain-containing protein [Planctomycetales bacterium]|nr:prepilin-type N-terminal cleavage/methylation domain-containing protein [Planctomycetales bacterium]